MRRFGLSTICLIILFANSACQSKNELLEVKGVVYTHPEFWTSSFMRGVILKRGGAYSPVEGARVVFTRQDDGKSVSTVTDINGNYAIRISSSHFPTEYEIRVSKKGFLTMEHVTYLGPNAYEKENTVSLKSEQG